MMVWRASIVLSSFFLLLLSVVLSERVTIKINRQSADSHPSYSNTYTTYSSNSNTNRYGYNAHTDATPAAPATIPDNPHINSTTNPIQLKRQPVDYTDPPASEYSSLTAEELAAATKTRIKTQDNSAEDSLSASVPLTWSLLWSQCYTFKIYEVYLYTVCPYHNITQTDLHTGATNVIGIYSSFKQSKGGLAQIFTDGSVCSPPSSTADSQAGNINRETKILFECSYEEEIQARYNEMTPITGTINNLLTTTSGVIPTDHNRNIAIVVAVSELKPCSYIVKLHTPLACSYSPHKPLPQHQPLSGTTVESSELGELVASGAELANLLAARSNGQSSAAVYGRMSECIQELHALNAAIHSEPKAGDDADLIERRLRLQMGDNIENNAQKLHELCNQFWTTQESH
jgi:hypothetical protein